MPTFHLSTWSSFPVGSTAPPGEFSNVLVLVLEDNGHGSELAVQFGARYGQRRQCGQVAWPSHRFRHSQVALVIGIVAAAGAVPRVVDHEKGLCESLHLPANYHLRAEKSVRPIFTLSWWCTLARCWWTGSLQLNASRNCCQSKIFSAQSWAMSELAKATNSSSPSID